MPKAPPSKEQIAAWLYEVMRPILQGLSLARYFLALKNPTWRFTSRRCENIMRTSQLVGTGQRPNLDQFCRYNEDQGNALKKYDALVEELESSARLAEKALAGLEATRELVARLDREFPGWEGNFPNRSTEEKAKFLIENLINFAEVDPPENYHISAAWKQRAAEIRALRKEPHAAEAAGKLESALDTILAHVASLFVSLSKLRDDLADEHGLPAAPASAPDTGEKFF